MNRAALTLLFLALVGLAWTQGTGVSGNGKMRFKVLYTSKHLPAESQKEEVLKKAHGGFAVDRRPGRGETYFALPGAGIIQISADLKSTKMLNTAPEVRDASIHNATIFEGPDGAPYLALPGNGVSKVFITNLEGKLVHTINAPDGTQEMGSTTANNYYLGRGNFIPTDVEYLNGLFYIATGYSNLDMILTAKVTSANPFRTEWNDLSFGGRGANPGQFGTSHGITIPPGTTRIDVSDRPNAEIDRFNRHGHYLSTVRMPLGSLPCDIFYHGKYAVVGSLDGPDRSKGAPIYIMEDDKLISTVMVKEDLGLPNFLHIHNAVLRELNGKIYIIAQAWNPGDFAVLEQVQ
ncbi:MAG: hypothetical protein FJW31_28345 [Acidobacteria bacterium]|nr:hypothetical protein [Acidobacteriota bacterium]